MGQTIATGNFFFYGKRHFTQKGYFKHLESYKHPVQKQAAVPLGTPGADGADLTNRVVVVTGANSGLGRQVAIYSAAKGAKLYMLCRSRERGQKARDEIAHLTGNDAIELVVVDVGELANVRQAAATIQAKEDKIHALVCNAGVLLTERRESSEGVEATFASHLLGGTYLLSKLLIPQLEAQEGSRVVIVTSGGMYTYKLPPWEVLTNADKENYDGFAAYSYAKRGQVLLAERWAKEYPNIAMVTAHPGWSDTAALDDAFGSATKFFKPLRTHWEGAEGISWLVATDKKNIQSGELYLDRSVEPKHISGPFFTEGSMTKNKESEVEEYMKKLKEAAGV